MKNRIQLNSIKQGLWTDNELLLLKEQLTAFFQIQSASSTLNSLKITNYLLQRLVLITGLSRNNIRDMEKIKEIKLKSATYFEATFHNNELYPLLTALLKIHYQNFEIDWDNTLETSKIINYEMEEGAKILLATNQLEQLFSELHP